MVLVAVPGGVWRADAGPDERPIRELALRPVGEADDAFVLETADSLAPCARATALLARCLDADDAERTARALTVGDREALLLHLRRLTIGETLDCVLRCPAEGCGERMELELRVADLLVPAYAHVRRTHELTAESPQARYKVSFRLPTAADLDDVALLARRDPDRAARMLLSRCLASATRDDMEVAADSLAPTLVAAITDAMADSDPQAQIELELACPACDAAFAVVFDTASFFLQELDERAARLLHEVHTLAWHYHWSERDILQMPRGRRARYMELVAESARQARSR